MFDFYSFPYKTVALVCQNPPLTRNFTRKKILLQDGRSHTSQSDSAFVFVFRKYFDAYEGSRGSFPPKKRPQLVNSCGKYMVESK